MVRKLARFLEDREINPTTGEVWSINDVHEHYRTWEAKTRAKVEADGYEFLPDGTAQKVEAE